MSTWRKSSFSGELDCVELRGDLAAVRDSKNPTAGVLRVTPRAVRELLLLTLERR